jgi:hypothetical protein
MLLAVVAAAVICPVSSPNPPSTATPLQTIGHVTATFLCSGLRIKIAPSISGLRVNDRIISQGQLMMAKLRFDALADPRSASATGGAGASSEMDDVQMAQLIQALTNNLKKIDSLLNDPAIFPDRATTDDQRALDLAKARLEAVAVGQHKILNILATTLQTNQTNDLLSKCDPVDCPTGGPTPERLSLPKALASEVTSEQQVESDVTPAVVALVQRCLRVH